MCRNKFYVIIYTIFKPLMMLLYPLKIQGREKVPQGAALICPNHSHAMDPFLVCFALGKKDNIHIMAKKQLMKIPLIGVFLRGLGAYGVDRGNSDLNAVKDSMRFLKEGDKVLIFPEGTRVHAQGEVQAKGGVAMLATRCQVPLVPVYCGERKRLFHKVSIIFGDPYEPQIQGKRATPEENQEIADEILRRAYALKQKV